jgi:hypothetical protein
MNICSSGGGDRSARVRPSGGHPMGTVPAGGRAARGNIASGTSGRASLQPVEHRRRATAGGNPEPAARLCLSPVPAGLSPDGKSGRAGGRRGGRSSAPARLMPTGRLGFAVNMLGAPGLPPTTCVAAVAAAAQRLARPPGGNPRLPAARPDRHLPVVLGGGAGRDALLLVEAFALPGRDAPWSEVRNCGPVPPIHAGIGPKKPRFGPISRAANAPGDYCRNRASASRRACAWSTIGSG